MLPPVPCRAGARRLKALLALSSPLLILLALLALLTRPGSDRRFEAVFDLSKPVPLPPPAWGSQ